MCSFALINAQMFAYADDVLLSPTVSSLRKQLELCDQFSQEFNINFNATKSKLVVYGKNDVHVEFKGQTIPICSDEFHVGNLVGSNHAVDQIAIKHACDQLYSRLNLLIRQFSYVDSFTLYSLFNTFCMSMYGSQL